MKKVNVGIIGTGNIGCDLLFKILKSEHLNCSLFMGRHKDSKGMLMAKEMSINTSDRSIEALVENPNICDIVFDATTAAAHFEHAKILKKLGKYTIDLTPSLVGKMCVPCVNAEECLNETNINMVTCGGQATIPLVHAISSVQKGIRYVEIVASIASKSAGPGTRANIDEFTQTTKKALTQFSGIKNAKAIIILNPANPPIMMNNTIHMILDHADMDLINNTVKNVISELKQYIPGYELLVEPVYRNNILTMSVQVEGSGDYLEKYSGNLDIITCASVKMAEMYALRRVNNERIITV